MVNNSIVEGKLRNSHKLIKKTGKTHNRKPEKDRTEKLMQDCNFKIA